MDKQPPVQLDTCKACGMPYGSPNPEMSASRLYCKQCANLPGNIMVVLDQHTQQLAEKTKHVKDPMTAVEPPEK